MRRLTLVLAITLTLFTTAAVPAYAAAPTNDTFAGAVVIRELPFDATIDTSQATTDAVDTEANTQCGAPATDASVWFAYTAPADGAVLFTMQGSSYQGGFLVVTGAPGSLRLVDCGPDAVAFPVAAGQTYYIMAIDDQSDGGGNGGTLNISAQLAPPPPEVDVALNPDGAFNKDGSATLSGTITCTGQVDFAFVITDVSQRVGRGVVFGSSGADVQCDGVSRPWSVTVFPEFGTKYAGGKAASVAFSVACGPVFCGTDYEQRVVQLKRK